ncbi:MAG TPA: hypothetical protein VGQ53_10650, partial [Chitinophagaceae bacterium]|nr:hypothetical protein [Chitinophagaceae bacterium]
YAVFLIQVERMEPATANKLFDLVTSGGRVFCIESYPGKSPGLNDHLQRDKELEDWIIKLKTYPDRFILLKKPDNNFNGWFRTIQEKYKIIPYVRIDSPNPFLSQVRYQANETEMLFIINSSLNDNYNIEIVPSTDISSGKQSWLWNPETGERHKMRSNGLSIKLEMGPADLKVLVFDKEKKGSLYRPRRRGNLKSIELKNPWSLTGNHINGATIKREINILKDLKDIPEWVNFCGSLVYNTNLDLNAKNKIEWINLGKVFGVSELFINGQNAGTKWYGKRIFHIGKFLKNGNNSIEIYLTTIMGNYMKSLTDNPIAQFWTNEGTTIQPLQSIGMLGPVEIY